MPLHRHQLLIVDDNPFFSACLSSLINAEPDLAVCGHANSGAALDMSLMVCAPDLILLDLGLGTESGLGIARGLRRRDVTTPLMFISSLGTPPAATLRRIGRCTFWKKGDGDDGFLRLIRKVLSEFAVRGSTANRETGRTTVATHAASHC
jgi:chemotaxis response regulator CheB